MPEFAKKCPKNEFFQPLHNDTKSVLSIKESYSMKKGLKFSQMPSVRLGVDERKKAVLVFDDFP